MELEIPDEHALPEAELERALTREAVRHGLERLPEDQREILLLREIQGLSYDEISAILDLEAGTVKSRIFRARKSSARTFWRTGTFPMNFRQHLQRRCESMPNCEKYQELISRMIDFELSEAEAVELKAHVASCPTAGGCMPLSPPFPIR